MKKYLPLYSLYAEHKKKNENMGYILHETKRKKKKGKKIIMHYHP